MAVCSATDRYGAYRAIPLQLSRIRIRRFSGHTHQDIRAKFNVNEDEEALKFANLFPGTFTNRNMV